MDYPDIRFALAHVSWPWTDECIAVFGKFQHVGSKGPDGEPTQCFIGCSPGTPPAYREQVFRMLRDVGYNCYKSMMFGIDTQIGNYATPRTRETLARDRELLQRLQIPPELSEAYWSDNALRFLGES